LRRVTVSHYGLLVLKPVESSGEAEYAHEGRGRLLVACRNSPPLLQPGPEPLDDIAIIVDPVRTGEQCFIGLGRDRRSGSQAPDVLTKGMAGVAAIGHDPARHARQTVEQWNSLRQFVRLTRRNPKRDGAGQTIGDQTSLGAIAATRATKCFTMVSLSLRAPFRRAPAAF
jgi:hypothetical protein